LLEKKPGIRAEFSTETRFLEETGFLDRTVAHRKKLYQF